METSGDDVEGDVVEQNVRVCIIEREWRGSRECFPTKGLAFRNAEGIVENDARVARLKGR